MAYTAYLTRPVLALGDLQINDGVTYRFGLFDLDLGSVEWRRQRALSNHVHGGALVHAVKDMANLAGRVIVAGASSSAVEASVVTLTNALSQITYDLHILQDGTTDHAWRCEPADYRVELPRLIQGRVITSVDVEIPRLPVPLAGAF